MVTVRLQVINDDGKVVIDAVFPIVNTYEWHAGINHQCLMNKDGSGIASFKYEPEIVYDENYLAAKVKG